MEISNGFHKICALLFCLMLLIWAATSGAAHYFPSCTMTLLAFCWLGCSFLENRASTSTLEVPKLDNLGATTAFNAFWLCMIVFCVISLLPLPYGLINAISPKAAQYYNENAQLLGETPTIASLSVSRAHTSYALWLLLGQFALFNAASRTFFRRENIKLTLVAIFIAGALLVLMELTNTVIPGSASIGPTGSTALWHLGVPLNPNHAAGALASISVLAIASDLLKRHGDTALNKKVGRLAIWFVTSACMFMLQSRGAIMAWAIAHILLTAILIMRAIRTRAKTIIISIILMLSLGAGLAIISRTAIEQSIDEIQSANLSFSADEYGFAPPNADKHLEKTDLYADFIKLSKDWFPAGYGKNAFDVVFPKYQSFPFAKRFNHAENEPFEIIMEYGIPASFFIFIFLIIGSFIIIRTNSRYHSDRTINALILALVVLLLQNFFDFGLRYWTTGFLAVLYLGIICGRTDYLTAKSPSQSTPPKSHPKFKFALTITAFILTACSLATAIIFWDNAKDGLSNYQFQAFRQSFAQGLKLNSDGSIQFPDTAKVRSYQASRAASAAFPALVSQSLVLGSSTENDKINTYTSALSWIQTATHREPKNPQYSLRLAKLALALKQDDLAAQALSDTIENNTQKTLIADSELHQFSLNIFNKLSIRPQLASRLLQISMILLKARKFVESLSMADHADALNSPQIGRQIRYNTWLEMGFIEGAADIAQNITTIDNINDFIIVSSWKVTTKDIDDLLSIMRNSESTLNAETDYWRLRAIYTAYYAPTNNDTKSELSHILFKLNHIALSSSSCRFDALLAEAEYALRSGEISHANNAAQRALKLRPNSKQAQQILKATENK